MENGTMDSNTEIVDSHIILSLGNKSVKTCLNNDPSVTFQKKEELTRENTFSSYNGNSTENSEISFGFTNGDQTFDNCERKTYSSNPKVSNSSQSSISSVQNPINNNLETTLSNLSIKEDCDEVLSKTDVKCDKCDNLNLNNEYCNESNVINEQVSESGPEKDICLADPSPIHTDAQTREKEKDDDDGSEIVYICYESEEQMPDIMKLIQKDLSEPYSIYTYRYFIHNWPHLCFLAVCKGKSVGAIVCKLDVHRKVIKRGYIAMLAVDESFRKHGIGSNLVLKAIRVMAAEGADEVVLETEITNQPALRLYENLGFVRDKRLFRYYLNGVDALRLKLWLR